MNKPKDKTPQKKTAKTATIDLYFARIHYTDNFLVHVHVLNKKEFGINELICLRKTVHELTRNKPFAFLFFAEKDVTYTLELFQYANQTEKDYPTLATAIVLNNLALKLAANFYFNFYKPRNPYRVFTNQTEAKKWVMGFKPR